MSDLISREKTLDAIRDADVFVFYDADTEIDDAVEIAIRCTKKSVIESINDLPSAEPKTSSNGSITCVKPEKMHDRTMGDLISRQDAIDAVDSETVSTNPEHFKSSEKFIKFMDDVDIASFGKWKWANGFNTALVATRVQLKKLPSAEPEVIRCKDCKWWRQQTNYQGSPLSFGFCESDDMWRSLYGETYEVSHIDTDDDFYCGYAERRGEQE